MEKAAKAACERGGREDENGGLRLGQRVTSDKDVSFSRRGISKGVAGEIASQLPLAPTHTHTGLSLTWLSFTECVCVCEGGRDRLCSLLLGEKNTDTTAYLHKHLPRHSWISKSIFRVSTRVLGFHRPITAVPNVPLRHGWRRWTVHLWPSPAVRKQLLLCCCCAVGSSLILSCLNTC